MIYHGAICEHFIDFIIAAGSKDLSRTGCVLKFYESYSHGLI